MMNSMYSLEVYTKNHKPIFVVGIKSPLLIGVHFFNTLNEANTYIQERRNELESYGQILIYDVERFVMDEKMFSVVKYVIESDDIAIGSDGRTYSIKM